MLLVLNRYPFGTWSYQMSCNRGQRWIIGRIRTSFWYQATVFWFCYLPGNISSELVKEEWKQLFTYSSFVNDLEKTKGLDLKEIHFPNSSYKGPCKAHMTILKEFSKEYMSTNRCNKNNNVMEFIYLFSGKGVREFRKKKIRDQYEKMMKVGDQRYNLPIFICALTLKKRWRYTEIRIRSFELELWIALAYVLTLEVESYTIYWECWCLYSKVK